MVTFSRFQYQHIDMIDIEVDGWPCTSANHPGSDVISVEFDGQHAMVCYRESCIGVDPKDAQAIIDHLKMCGHPVNVVRTLRRVA